MAFAFFVAYAVTLREARRAGLDRVHIHRLLFLVLYGSFLGARAFAWIFEDPRSAAGGSTAFYGGAFAGVGILFIYARLVRVKFGALLDTTVPGLALGIFVGRLGCFAAGCCWGAPTQMPWGVTAPGSPAGSPLLHPTQLYDAAVGLALYLILRRRSGTFDGGRFLWCALGYSLARVVTEGFRGDTYRGFVLEGVLSSSQFVSLLVAAATALGLTLCLRHHRSNSVVSKSLPS